ncbi:MAG: nitrogenase component 1 [Candidatus Methanoplasma sp.]|jgi:nitrogenase molybdenum-iron protein alpha/beta subunit|nr:nitrogenase component 1 [Candidatus Methanoplasma sp.]
MPLDDKICMDGFTGALLAVDSFDGMVTVLHGPGGCRNYHTFMTTTCYPRRPPKNFKKYAHRYFYWTARIPCTYMDETDYINGAEDKIEDVLDMVKDVDGGMAVFIKSPGAALIGDNVSDVIERRGYSGIAMAIEESLISQPFSSSYDGTVRDVIAWRRPERGRARKGTANLLGLPITSRSWRDSLSELEKILSMCGVEVISSPGAGCSISDIADSANAELNVMVCPEYGSRTAEYYEKAHGIPCVRGPDGAPVGFDATESWIRAVADAAGTDPSEALRYVDGHKRRAAETIDKLVYNQRTRGCRFAVHADSSVLLPLSKWLYGYLCMLPVHLSAEPGEDAACMRALGEFVSSRGLEGCLSKDIAKSGAHFAFADGQMAETLELMGSCRKGIGMCAPDLACCSFIPKPVFGAHGAMYLLDEIFNGQ